MSAVPAESAERVAVLVVPGRGSRSVTGRSVTGRSVTGRSAKAAEEPPWGASPSHPGHTSDAVPRSMPPADAKGCAASGVLEIVPRAVAESRAGAKADSQSPWESLSRPAVAAAREPESDWADSGGASQPNAGSPKESGIIGEFRSEPNASRSVERPAAAERAEESAPTTPPAETGPPALPGQGGAV
jgi:hypothetical protein